MWTPMQLTLYCLFCNSLGLIHGYRQRGTGIPGADSARYNSLVTLGNRDASLGSSKDAQQNEHTNYDLNNFILQEYSRNMAPGEQVKHGRDAILSRYIDGNLDAHDFNVNGISAEFPKSSSLVSQVLSPRPDTLPISADDGESRSKRRYRASVADRIGHGFGKRGDAYTANRPSLGNGRDFFLANIRDILKAELLKRIIYNDDYEAIVAYLDAFNDKTKDSGKFRSPSNGDYETGSLPIPLRSATAPNADDSFFSGAAGYGSVYDSE